MTVEIPPGLRWCVSQPHGKRHLCREPAEATFHGWAGRTLCQPNLPRWLDLPHADATGVCTRCSNKIKEKR